ncbi:beta-N-acetylhexosaminidase [Streptomyces flavofungini]|uniref:beta-N-acetylhexosaminidase n=1 Tax=Streptomyces flavofungini TaxID=68200 RepID=UPI0025AFB47D|nr:beta-N-acetylhexosaminidase [Streptomyces flavofungini]WJV48560.1 beta-N-acetylhexosaminidase [Streptomyces flavofungini]
MRQHHRTACVIASLLLIAAAGTSSSAAAPTKAPDRAGPTPLGQIVPAPMKVEPGGAGFEITAKTLIRVGGDPDERRIAEYLAGILRPSTGYRLPVTDREGEGGIRLRISAEPENKVLGGTGYRVISTRGSLTITSWSATGLRHGVQTVRQQLPAAVEKKTPQRGPWRIAGGTIKDMPRYAYRGAMLDVSRHFFPVEHVKRYIDQLALYKMNKLHLHLSDDQGWRIAIDSWPRLATYGGSTQVGGGPGGYYTKDQYKDIVAYASSRGLQVIPEIDMPGHTNAALASYAELNCNGVAPPLYTGTNVGFSSLCVNKDVTYEFVDDVVRELAALTPGGSVHIGGDEAHSTSDEDFVTFMGKVQPVVAKYGKTVMGWHQLAGANPAKDAVVQYWGYDRTGQAERDQVVNAAKKGTKLVLSPADRAYLDMKYDKDTPLGLTWAGYVEVQRAYDWDPGTYLQGAPADAVLGVEAPLWTETLSTPAHLDYMAFPRLPGIAELGWSPAATHDWGAYKGRLAGQAPRWDALGINYYKSPQVPWPAER